MRSLSRDLIAALDMGDELGEDPDKGDENEEQEAEEDSGRTATKRQKAQEQESEQQASEDMQEAEGESEVCRNGSHRPSTAMTSPTIRKSKTTRDGEEPYRPQLAFLEHRIA